MVRELLRYGDTIIVKMFFAPSILSGEAIGKLISNFNVLLGELSVREGLNIFLKRIVKERDYYAIVAIETSNTERAFEIIRVLEEKLRGIGIRARKRVMEEIASLKKVF